MFPTHVRAKSGLLPYINNIRFYNDLGHPICRNLRSGLWLPHFLAQRIKHRTFNLSVLSRFIEVLFKPLDDVPYDLRPCYFEALFSLLHETTVEQLMNKLNPNLRSGLWLPRFLAQRIKHRTFRLSVLSRFIEVLFKPLEDVPYDLRPCYFEALFSLLHETTVEQLMNKLNPAFNRASVFVKTLALSSVALLGAVQSAKLALLPETYKFEDKLPTSLAAGLPHFSVGIWRNWGRDTFIALPGCCLITGRFFEARYFLLS
ncbi:unnamed protein product [Gongylonema pulchrum]|uniref:BLM10_mid domain-containing protein n=1 Tax=Gongylonema pulchrum TaxID=637853 RepID=A0A183E542_9BILA|nr:unnamed protein product [Gongylonema pulchrum]